jgi:hypothetical protein
MANEEEPRDPEEERGGPEDELSQDPFVERLRPDPSEPPIPVRVLEGLLGSSDREGYWRLYFTRELDYYAEFRAEDVVYSEPIPPDQPPFLGQQATRVGIRRDATIEYTRVRTPRPVDEFDLDVRLGGAPSRGGALPLGTEQTRCLQNTCETCDTVCAATCNTCHTECGQPTCALTCDTCHTQCGQATCGQAATCQFTCAGHTCVGHTCGTCANTCGLNCIPTELPPHLCRTRFGHAC